MWVIFNKKNWINGRNCIKFTLKLIKLTKYWHKTKWLTKFWYKVVNFDIKWCVNVHFKTPINTMHITITNHLFCVWAGQDWRVGSIHKGHSQCSQRQDSQCSSISLGVCPTWKGSKCRLRPAGSPSFYFIFQDMLPNPIVSKQIKIL